LKTLRSRAHKALIAALREARKQAGLSQHELGKRLKRPQSFVSAYESGQRRVEVLEFLQITNILGTDACEILKQLEK
jgi:transcriptional regulator with XRE-family HTH domain